jgi:hypothetical protein
MTTYAELQKKYPEAVAEALAAGRNEERENTRKCIALLRKPAFQTRDTITAMIFDRMEKGEVYAEILQAASDLLTADLESPEPVKTMALDSASGEADNGGTGGFTPGQIGEV